MARNADSEAEEGWLLMADAAIQLRKMVRGGIEYRFDPLTQHLSRLNPARARRPKQAEAPGQLQRLIQESAESCPFCPSRIEEVTPTFPPELWGAGRIRRGETVVFPNLHPFGENHAVGTIAQAHHAAIDSFRPAQLLDNMIAARTYFRVVHEHDPEARLPVYVWNYMPPSAGSILHPHVQLMLERDPLPRLRDMLDRSRTYERVHGRSFWRDLVEAEERRGERFIDSNESFGVLATFAPRGFREVAFVFHEATCLASLDRESMTYFSESLARALKAYRHMGVGSFNLASFSAPMDTSAFHFALVMVLVSRPYPSGIYTNDSGPMERLYDAWVIDTLPELVAKAMRPYFEVPDACGVPETCEGETVRSKI